MGGASNSFRDALDDLFAGAFSREALRAADPGVDSALWSVLAEFGLPLALASEADGGAGFSLCDAVSAMSAVGGHGVPLPIMETLLANWLRGAAGFSPCPEPSSAAGGEAWTLTRQSSGWRLEGSESRVAWARAGALTILVEGEHETHVALAEPNTLEITHGLNLAGEPRDDVRADVLLTEEQVRALPGSNWRARFLAVGAAMRANAMAGAMRRALAMSVAHAQERSQFGKPIGAFQAIQHAVALVASASAASDAIADIAAAAAADGSLLPVAAAKIRIGEAAGKVAALAHQIHGAIGITREHDLHRFTTRLWSWRDEFGGEAEWSAKLGAHVAASGAEALWPLITQSTSA